MMTSLESTDTSLMQAPVQEHKPTHTIADILKDIGALTTTMAKTTTTSSTSNTETPPKTPTPTPTTMSSLCGSPKATTRIPHPQPHPHPIPLPHPVASLLAASAAVSPFQRSASMRTRGTKSHLLFDTTASDNGNEMNRNTAAVNTPTCELAATAGFSARRKVALRSSPTRALHQTAVSQHLTRSLSLHRNHKNSGHKTATPKDCGKVHTLAQCAPKTDMNASAANENVCDHSKLCNAAANVNQDNMAANCDSGVGGNSHETVQAKRNMSLNLIGGDSNSNNTTTTTTAAIIAEATGNDIATATAAEAAATVDATTTPKSPTTALTTQVTAAKSATTSSKTTPLPSQHSCARQAHCTKSAYKLSTVLETKLSPKTPPVTPDSPSTYLDDDLDSMYSFATTTSGRSTMSCEHPYVARNGTTFSGRKMKYVVHCSNYAGQVGPDYLTPTQRAQRQIKRLKELLCIARQDLEQKDSEILRLTREVVELRLFKASLSSPEERSASSDAVTVREAELKTSQDVSPIVDMVDDAQKASPRHLARQQLQTPAMNSTPTSSMQISSEMQSSFADSGHFEDITTSSVHSKDSHTQDIACGSDANDLAAAERGSPQNLENYELQRQELIRMYEQRIEELIRTQDSATTDLKRSHNDKVEALLQKLAECNTRYADIVPDYEHAKERIRELEKQLEDLQRKLLEHEEKQNKMYLHMYQKGQEAERLARADQALELAHRNPDSKVSINELLHQLQSTQDELENIRAAECRKNECGSNHALLTAKEAISLWVLGARKTIYRRLMEAQKNRTYVDPEVTLQFLKSAVYYFLTDKENSQGHLQAIESILQFTESEKQNISKARAPK